MVFTLVFFFIAQLGFVGANVFYDGFLPDLTTPETIDKVSSKGFAIGYIGGGIYLLLVFAAIFTAAEPEFVTRIGVAGTGVWWAGFSLFAFSRLRETGASSDLPDEVVVAASLVRGIGLLISELLIGLAVLLWALLSGASEGLFNLLLGGLMVALVVTVLRVVGSSSDGRQITVRSRLPKMATIGFSRTFTTAARLRHFPQLLLFVFAFMLYNDGVQTTINISAAFGSSTLGLSTTDIALTFLIVQFVAFGGAYLFGWFSGRTNIRRAILVNLTVWVLVAMGAFFLPEGNALAFQLLGVVIGFILGGIQALSRSLYGSMIPEQASAEFYGFYSVFSKFSAIWGPLIYVMVAGVTGSGRPAILSIALFFGLGMYLFSRVDIDAARASKERWSIEGLDISTDTSVG